MIKGRNDWPLRRRLFVSEFLGTAVLLLVGLSVVILMFGTGSPFARLLPNEALRRTITGFLFGTTGALIALSWVGKASGAHLNPVVTLGFWLMRKVDSRTAAGYALAQVTGASAGVLPLLAWGAMGRSVAFGATTPGEHYSLAMVFAGEAITTFAMIAGLCLFLASRNLRRFTPAMFPLLYGVMVPLEAAISGTSTNPARTLGPAIISGQWHGWWIYWAAPLIGTLVAILVCSLLARRIEVAKLYHFDNDRDRLFRRMAATG